MAADEWASERRRLTALHEKATDAFDRAIMTLSGGALGVSLVFIDDVAPNPNHKGILGASWACFAASLLLILWSFLASERAIVKMVEQGDQTAEEIPRGKLTDFLNWASAGAFVLGVVFLVIFSWLNV